MMHRGRVLLLSAEPFFGEMLAAAVREDGHEVEVAATLAGAVDLARAGWPHVVVVEALSDPDIVGSWLSALGNAGARVALVYGRDTANVRYHPAVAYAMFAQASLDELRLFLARCSEPRGARAIPSSGVRARDAAEEEIAKARRRSS